MSRNPGKAPNKDLEFPAASEPLDGSELVNWAAGYWVNSAKHGRSTGVDRLLEICIRCLEQGQALPANAAQYLAELLSNIRAKESPWGVPLFKRGRGQKSADDYEVDYTVAQYYWQLTVKQRMKPAAAELQVSQTFTWLSTDDVRNRWRKLRHLFPGE